MYKYKKKAIIYLIVYLLLFLIAFFIAFFNLKSGKSVLNLGLPYQVEDSIIMAFSIAGIIKVVYEIITIEHHN